MISGAFLSKSTPSQVDYPPFRMVNIRLPFNTEHGTALDHILTDRSHRFL